MILAYQLDNRFRQSNHLLFDFTHAAFRLDEQAFLWRLDNIVNIWKFLNKHTSDTSLVIHNKYNKCCDSEKTSGYWKAVDQSNTLLNLKF